ncbi:DUF3717 domain-containing protein [Allopusillimonas soli]|uniref:DUF3717 domain-containing protein n=1 Tax=Allopusillimonas soli TaxID=659016 RepID=A0A853F9H3_9BURK|nr:DUF3717 domain-containing protein [Allopusillimonas soli]NYT37335.1 DUF3717 domain-containing protein [Allopusillimonas soli]TEA74681.1 DUF3717 domain-containing protein [Allopusillimonas soli]
MTTHFTLADLEAAINFWRAHSPSRGEELELCPEAAALAEPYAFMIIKKRTELPLDVLDSDARAALETWRAQVQRA